MIVLFMLESCQLYVRSVSDVLSLNRATSWYAWYNNWVGLVVWT